MRKASLNILFLILVLAGFASAQVDRQAIPHSGRLASPPNCLFKGQSYYDTATDHYRKCTVIGSPGTWIDMDAGITNGAGSNVIPKSDGTNLVAATGLTQPSATTLKATVQTNTDVGLNITGAASQSGDLTQWNSSTPTTLAKMTAGGQLAFPGVAASTYQLDLTRTSTGGDQKGIQIQCGTGSNLAANICFSMTDGAGHGLLQTFNGTGYITDINSNTYTMQTSGGVGEGSIRFNPGSFDRVVLPKEKSLSNNTVTSIADITLPTLTGIGGVISGTTFVSNGTDIQSRSFMWRFTAVNKGGVYTTEIAVVNENISTSSGTLAGTWTIVSGTNKITLKFNSNSSLTPTTQWVQFNLQVFGEQAVTIL